MRIIDKELIYDNLIRYGFKNNNNNDYLYEKDIWNNRFKVIIKIKNNKIISKLIDNSIDEEYLLADVKNVIGEYNNQLKIEYENIINDFINKCCILNIYKNKQTQEIICYIKEKYGDDLEFLWEKSPTSSIWRNKDNKKWYGILMVIKKDKLKFNSNENVEIIDLRYQKDEIESIIDNKKIYPGFHMNKKSWITIILDNSMDTKKIYNLIDNSYSISINN